MSWEILGKIGEFVRLVVLPALLGSFGVLVIMHSWPLIMRVAKKWQGLIALVLAVVVFWFSPRIVHHFYPTDVGFMPGQYLQAILMGVVIFFVGIWAAWQALQLDFKAINRHLDGKGAVSVFNLIDSISNPATKLCVLIAPFFLLLFWFAAALWLAANLLG